MSFFWCTFLFWKSTHKIFIYFILLVDDVYRVDKGGKGLGLGESGRPLFPNVLSFCIPGEGGDKRKSHT